MILGKENLRLILDALHLARTREKQYINVWKNKTIVNKSKLERINTLIDDVNKQYENSRTKSRILASDQYV